jgi:hypothetical protein
LLGGQHQRADSQIAALWTFKVLVARACARVHLPVQNWRRSSLGLANRIKSAHERRSRIISFPGRTPNGIASEHAAAELIYQGHVAPLRNKADRFHVCWFSDPLKLRTNVIVASIMRECCGNVAFAPLWLSKEDVWKGIAALKRTKITKTGVRELIAPHLPSPRHRLALQDLDNDLFEVVDVLTAIGRAERINFITLGLFAGLLMTSATSVGSGQRF